MHNKKKELITAVCFLGMFIFIFAFFYFAHPLIIFDGDDWYGVSSMRAGAIPNPLSFNPIKVLPETLFPLIGRLAVTFIYPWKGDYLRSLSMAMAIFIALLIVAYTYMFYDFLKRKMRKGSYSSLILSVLFLLFHFLIFRKDRMFNAYMFASGDANCYFNYMAPFLFNASMVFYFFSRDIESMFSKENIGKNIVKKSIIVLILYLCVFSNLFQNGILSLFFTVLIIHNLINMVKEDKGGVFKNKIVIFISQNKIKVVYILIWLLSLPIENAGERANLAASGGSILTRFTFANLGNTFNGFAGWILKFNRLFIPIALGSVTVFLFMVIKKYRDEYSKESVDIILLAVFSGLLNLCYLFLLCTVVQSLRRIDIANGVFFYLIFIVVVCIAYICEKLTWIKLTLPLLSFVVLCETMFGISVYQETTFDYPPEVCYSVGNYIIQSVIEADRDGKEEVHVKIPDIEYYAVKGGREHEYLGLALYRHGLVSKRIKVFTEVDRRLDLEFGIVSDYKK